MTNWKRKTVKTGIRERERESAREVSQKAADPSVDLCVALLVSELHFFFFSCSSLSSLAIAPPPLGFFIHAEMTATAISAYLCALHLELNNSQDFFTSQEVVVHTFNPSTWKAEADGSM